MMSKEVRRVRETKDLPPLKSPRRRLRFIMAINLQGAQRAYVESEQSNDLIEAVFLIILSRTVRLSEIDPLG